MKSLPLSHVPASSYSITANRPGKSYPVYFSLVVPTYNEAPNIADVVQQLTQLLDQVLPGDYELIVVDDNSPDRTWEVAQALMPDYPGLRVVRRQHERGLSTAVVRGWQTATGEILGVIDGDLQHPPEVLLQLLRAIDHGADLAVASRNVDGGGVSSWSLVRRFLSRGAQMVGLVILPGVVGRVTDPMSGYFLVRRHAIAGHQLNPLGYKILIEVMARGDIRRIAEVGYVFQERQEGESKVTWKQYVDYLRHLIRLRFDLWRLSRFIRFALVGLSGLFVDLGLFYVLRSSLHLDLTSANVIAVETAILNNFLWNDFWTFRDVTYRQPSKRQRLKRFLKFNIICFIGLVLNTIIVRLLYDTLDMNEYLAKLVAIAIVTVWNFWINLKLSWRVTEVQKD